MTVRALLAYLRPFYPTWDDALGERLRRLLDLPPDQRLRTLSRGMRMKAALVASLAYRPRLLVMDEPFSGLDPVMRDDLVRGILELAGDGERILTPHLMQRLDLGYRVAEVIYPMLDEQHAPGPPCDQIDLVIERTTYAGSLTRTLDLHDFRLNAAAAPPQARASRQ
jgi:energy-coupling factor transporter ATP-binding protein EcfA2